MKLFIAILLSYSALTFGAGGVNGGGSDHLPSDHGAAWFLQGIPARTIKVCFQKDETKFPMSDADILAAFNYAMASWTQYIEDKKVNDVEEEEDDEINPIFFHVVTKYEILPKCGNEDLAVYLGYTNKQIDEVRASFFDPAAIAHKISYDDVKGWGKGFIWLQGLKDENFVWDKNEFLNLKGIFLHELGHVFGNDHRDGTIMDGTFAENLVDYEIPQDTFHWHFFKFMMTHIDWSEELIQCLTCSLVHEGGSLWLPGSRAEKETFKFLTDQYPTGEVVSRMELKVNGVEKLEGVYGVTDGHKTVNYPVHLLLNSLNFIFGNDAVFKRTLTIKEEEGEWTHIGSEIRSSNFTILSFMGWMEKDGKHIPVIFEGRSSTYENVSKYPEDRRPHSIIEKTYPYRLIALDGSERHVLFTKLKETKFNDEANEGKKQKRNLLHKILQK